MTDVKSPQRRCDWSFMDGGFAQVDDVSSARTWLSRDLELQHAVSIVELRGGKEDKAAIYFDLDHVDSSMLTRVVDYLTNEVLPTYLQCEPCDLGPVLTTTTVQVDNKMGAHIIVPNCFATADTLKKLRTLVCRLDSSLLTILDPQPLSSSLRMIGTSKAVKCKDCAEQRKQNKKKITTDWQFCKTCNSVGSTFDHSRKHQLQFEFCRNVPRLFIEYAWVCFEFALFLTSIRRRCSDFASDPASELVCLDPENSTHWIVRHLAFPSTVTIAKEMPQKSHEVVKHVISTDNSAVGKLNQVLLKSLHLVSPHYKDAWLTKIQTTLIENRMYLLGRLQEPNGKNGLLFCPFLQGFHTTNKISLDISVEGYRIHCFSKKKNAQGLVCADQCRTQDFACPLEDGSEKKSLKQMWSETISKYVSSVPPSNCHAVTKRKRPALPQNADIQMQNIQTSKTTLKKTANKLAKQMQGCKP